MPKPIFYGRLDFIELMTSVAMLNSDAEKSAWLMSFCTALAKNETGENDLADSILLEAQKARIEESKRKEAYRSKFVPRTDTDRHGLTRERQTVSVPVSVSKEVNTNTVNTPPTPKGALVVSDVRFNEFWTAYPRKINRKGSEKAFRVASKLVSFDTLMIALENKKKSAQWSKNGGEYIPYPTTWLNQERWNEKIDEIEDTQSWAYLQNQLKAEFGANNGQSTNLIG